MRQINYILIHDTDPQAPVRAPRRRHDAHLGYHYVVNAAGVVRNPLDIHQSGTFAAVIRNLNPFDRRDYNAFSIGIQYNGSLEEDPKQREALVELLIDLRSHFPEAKILTTSEIDGKSILPSDAMNRLRLELSDLP